MTVWLRFVEDLKLHFESQQVNQTRKSELGLESEIHTINRLLKRLFGWTGRLHLAVVRCCIAKSTKKVIGAM